MKRKVINDYAQNIVVRLYELGFFASIQESGSTNSFYIHISQTSNVIRLSDHGFNFEKYNFLPRQKTIRNVNGGKCFYSMSDNGIEAFINDFKHDNLTNACIHKCNETIVNTLKRYVLCHIPTNTYYCENCNSYGTVITMKLKSEKFSEMSEELKHILKLSFRPKLESAMIFKTPSKSDIQDIIFNYDSVDNYKFIEVEIFEMLKGKKVIKIKE